LGLNVPASYLPASRRKWGEEGVVAAATVNLTKRAGGQAASGQSGGSGKVEKEEEEEEENGNGKSESGQDEDVQIALTPKGADQPTDPMRWKHQHTQHKHNPNAQQSRLVP
jgi:hypothetical protein